LTPGLYKGKRKLDRQFWL